MALAHVVLRPSRRATTSESIVAVPAYKTPGPTASQHFKSLVQLQSMSRRKAQGTHNVQGWFHRRQTFLAPPHMPKQFDTAWTIIEWNLWSNIVLCKHLLLHIFADKHDFVGLLQGEILHWLTLHDLVITNFAIGFFDPHGIHGLRNGLNHTIQDNLIRGIFEFQQNPLCWNLLIGLQNLVAPGTEESQTEVSLHKILFSAIPQKHSALRTEMDDRHSVAQLDLLDQCLSGLRYNETGIDFRSGLGPSSLVWRGSRTITAATSTRTTTSCLWWFIGLGCVNDLVWKLVQPLPKGFATVGIVLPLCNQTCRQEKFLLTDHLQMYGNFKGKKEQVGRIRNPRVKALVLETLCLYIYIYYKIVLGLSYYTHYCKTLATNSLVAQMFKRGCGGAASTKSTAISCGTRSPLGIGEPDSYCSANCSVIMDSRNATSSALSQNPM